jgi:hypothetical protein
MIAEIAPAMSERPANARTAAGDEYGVAADLHAASSIVRLTQLT